MGKCSGSLVDVYNLAGLETEKTNFLGLGGIAGSGGQIQMSYNEGPVYGGDIAGGVSGSRGTIVASYNTAPVVGEHIAYSIIQK